MSAVELQATRDNGQVARTVDDRVDPRGRRIGRRDPSTGAWRYWLYQDQLEPVAELDDQGQLVARFLHATRAHTPDALIKYEAGQPVLYLLVSDHVGSSRANDGAIVQRIDFDAFGRLQLDTNPDFQPFGFAGGLHDRFTGLIRFGARDHDPTTGRWTDPIRWAGGQANLYAYVDGDPVNAIDPSGLEWDWPGAGRHLEPGIMGRTVDGIVWAKNEAHRKMVAGAGRDFWPVALQAMAGGREGGNCPPGWKIMSRHTQFAYGELVSAACADHYLQLRAQAELGIPDLVNWLSHVRYQSKKKSGTAEAETDLPVAPSSVADDWWGRRAVFESGRGFEGTDGVYFTSPRDYRVIFEW